MPKYLLFLVGTLLLFAAVDGADAVQACERLTDNPNFPCKQGPPEVHEPREFRVWVEDEYPHCVLKHDIGDWADKVFASDVSMGRIYIDDATGEPKSQYGFSFVPSQYGGSGWRVYDPNPFGGTHGFRHDLPVRLTETEAHAGGWSKIEQARALASVVHHLQTPYRLRFWAEPQEWNGRSFDRPPATSVNAISVNTTIDKLQMEIYDCAGQLTNIRLQKEEEERAAAERLKLQHEEAQARRDMALRLLLKTNELKEEQARLASALKIEEEETRVTLEIVALTGRVVQAQIAVQEARLAGLERRAEAMRIGATANAAAYQEFLMQTGSRFDQIEADQQRAREAVRQLRKQREQVDRRLDELKAAQDAQIAEGKALLDEVQRQLDDIADGSGS